MVVDVEPLTFCCVIGEDLQQVESDTVFKRLNRFLTGLVLVFLALEVGPRSDTDLLGDNTIPLQKGRFIEKVLIECENRLSGLPFFFVGDLDSLLGGFELSLLSRNVILSICDFLLNVRRNIGRNTRILLPGGRAVLGCNSLSGFFFGLLKLILGIDEKRLIVGDVFPITVNFTLERGPRLVKLAALDVTRSADDVDKELFGIPTCPHRRVDG